MSTPADKLITWGCCDGGLDGGKYRNCSICENAFHLACLANYDEELFASKAWSCPSCSNKNPKVPRDDNTPVRYNINVTTRAPKRQALNSPPKSPNSFNTLTTDDIRNVVQDVLQDQLSNMLTKINDSIALLMSEELRSVKQELKSAVDSVNAVKAQIGIVVTEHIAVKLSIENLKTQNSSMQRTIAELSTRLHRLEQNSHSRRVPSTSNADQDISSKPLSEPASASASSSEPKTDPVASEMASQTSSSNSQAPNSQEWSRVAKKSKSRRPVSIQGAAGPSVTSLRAVEARKYLHLWNMESTADEIRSYLHTLCDTDSCTIDELTPKGNYKSFKIGVPTACYERCYSADVWPVNARIKPWINYRKPSSIQSGSQRVVAPQPFHEQHANDDKAT